MIAVQRRRLGSRGAELARAALLELDHAEVDAEQAIRDLRHELARDNRRLRVQDHGAGTRGLLGTEGKPVSRRVADIYRRAAAKPGWGRFLYCLVRELRPSRVLELGTSLGVSAAHIAAALEWNEAKGFAPARLVTIEGDPGIAGVARAHLKRMGHGDRVEVVTGRFADVVPHVITDSFDLVFVDGHHEEAATNAYWEMLRPNLPADACVTFDDIEPGRPVRRAWLRIVAAERARGAVAVDLLGLGLLFMPAAGAGASESVTASEIGAVAVGQ